MARRPKPLEPAELELWCTGLRRLLDRRSELHDLIEAALVPASRTAKLPKRAVRIELPKAS